MADRPWIIGLTGGIGCGKTTVSDLFAEHGVPVVDTDRIAHELTGPQGKAMPRLVEAFGPEIRAADGRLDRAVMRQRVFADPAERQRLEAILHPMIFAEARADCTRLMQETRAPYILLVVPLLVEAGENYQALCQRILVVDCDEETQIQRVMHRSRMSRAEAEAMRAAQVGRAARRAVATDILENQGDQTSLREAVDRLDTRFRQLAKCKT